MRKNYPVDKVSSLFTEKRDFMVDEIGLAFAEGRKDNADFTTLFQR